MCDKRILIIEDDPDAADVLTAYLQREHFRVFVAADGLKGLEMAQQCGPDLVLLDVMLPSMSGTEILGKLRGRSDVPVIMVTAMGDETDKIGALRYGADDYVVKPYRPGEVVARVQAVLRRTATRRHAPVLLRDGSLTVDSDAMTAVVEKSSGANTLLDLTPTEFCLLATLLRVPTKAFSRQALLEQCLPDSEALERVVDTHTITCEKSWRQSASVVCS